MPIRGGGKPGPGNPRPQYTWRWCASLFCDESGVGFAALLAENSTPLWSHHSVSRSDGTWLPKWSGNLGGVQRWCSPVAWGPGASQSAGHHNETLAGGKSGLGAGAV